MPDADRARWIPRDLYVAVLCRVNAHALIRDDDGYRWVPDGEISLTATELGALKRRHRARYAEQRLRHDGRPCDTEPAA